MHLLGVVLQAIGAPIGAYLVIHLEPHKTQLCIAIALTVVFFLMALKPAKVRSVIAELLFPELFVDVVEALVCMHS